MKAGRVLVAEAGVSGQAAAAVLVAAGWDVLVTDVSQERLDALRLDGVRDRRRLSRPPASVGLVVTSPGWRPDESLWWPRQPPASR